MDEWNTRTSNEKVQSIVIHAAWCSVRQGQQWRKQGGQEDRIAAKKMIVIEVIIKVAE